MEKIIKKTFVAKFIFSKSLVFKFNVMVMFIVALIWAVDLSFRKYLVKEILDQAIISKVNEFSGLFLPVACYLLMCLLVTTSFRIYGYYVDTLMMPSLKQKLADSIFCELISKNYIYYKNNSVGDLVHKVNNAVDGSEELIKLVVNNFFGYSIALFCAIYTLATVNQVFAIATSFWLITFTVISFSWYKHLDGLANIYAASNTQVSGYIADMLNNITSIHLFNRYKHERIKFLQIYKKKVFADRKLNFAYFWVWFAYGYSFDLLQAISLYFIFIFYQQNILSPGDIILIISINVTVVDFMNQLTNNLTKFSNNYGKVNDALLSIFTNNHTTRSLKYESYETNPQHLVFSNIKFGYPNKKTLFQDLTVSIKLGEKVGLVGYSGSGKSTFINLILRLYDVADGHILINQTPIDQIPIETLRSNISVVTQEIALFNGTIFYNIIYGNKSSDKEDVIKAAKLADIHEFIMLLPKQYETYIGVGGISLSGGEKQRIILARAFVRNASVLLLDEATSQLDLITEQKIQKKLLKFTKDKTLIMATHRLSSLTYMDRVLVFNKGTIVQDGNHIQLISQRGLYQDLWNTQTNEQE